MRLPAAASALILALPAWAAADPAEELADILAGSFTTLEQSRTEGWGYVESEMVRIWPDREDGVWLYQENAFLGASPDDYDPEIKQRPYFQRIVRLAAVSPVEVVRTIYSLSDPEVAVGAWANPSRVGEDQLADANCSGPVERIARGHWIADFDTCPSNLRGAVRTRSRSIHTPHGFANWDRGYDAEGRLVWGPEAGGYVFVRKED
jgi:hypothetical protein